MNTLVRRPPHVVIANYSGVIVGDDAIFESLLAMVTRACGPETRVSALTAAPGRTRARYPVVAAEHVYSFGDEATSLAHVARMLAEADLLLIGGGDIIEGQQAFGTLTALARLAGTPIAYAGVGVLRPQSARGRWLLAWSANRASYIATRDAESARLLGELGVRRPRVATLPDLAVAFPDADAPAAPPVTLAGDTLPQRAYIALNLRAPDAEQYGATWGDAEYEAIAGVCRDLIAETGLAVVCVSLMSATALRDAGLDWASDDALLLDLARRIDRPDDVYVLRGDYRPAQVSGIIAGAQVALGMRLHFLLLAANAGTPPVALSYARKVRALMDDLTLARFCQNASALDAAALAVALRRALAEHDSLAASLAQWRAERRRRLQQLEPVIAGLAGRQRLFGRARQALAPAAAQSFHPAMGMYQQIKVGAGWLRQR